MLRWKVLAIIGCCFLWFSPISADASGLRIRALLANPAVAEETEWMALENESPATVSASLTSVRDTFGKVVEYDFLGDFQPKEVRVIPRTLSGITLNNDTEGAELLVENQVVQTVLPFVSPGNDQVWVELSGVWQYVSLEEWSTRLVRRDWSRSVTSPPTPAPIPSPSPYQQASLVLALFSPCTSPEWIEIRAETGGLASQIRVEDSSGVLLKLEELEFSAGESRRLEWAGAKLSNAGEWVRVVFPGKEELFSYDACVGSVPYVLNAGKWKQTVLTEEAVDDLAYLETAKVPDNPFSAPSILESQPLLSNALFFEPDLASASGVFNPELPHFPQAAVPDFATEEQVFLHWKRTSLIGSLALVLGGGTLLLLVLPSLLSWYNKHRDPW